MSLRPDVRRHHADDQEADRPRLCAAAHALGAAVRSHADEGRRRNASRRCRPTTSSPTSSAGTAAASAPARTRPAMLPREYAREAYKRGLQYEQQAGRQPLQVRHGRLDRCAHLAVDHDRGQLLRQGGAAGTFGAPGPLRRGHRRALHRRQVAQVVRLDDQRVGPGRRLGAATTRARRCGTRWRARRSMPPPARGCRCGCSAASTSRPRTWSAATSPKPATRAACRWAAT